MTALDLAEYPEDRLRKKYGVTLVRTALELRGIDCSSHLRDSGDFSQSIAYSRCFGEPIRDFDSLSESVAYYLGRAAEKLRAEGQRAGGAGVYFVYYPEYSPRKLEGGVASANVVFPRATDDTSEMLKYVLAKLPDIFWRAGDTRRAESPYGDSKTEPSRESYLSLHRKKANYIRQSTKLIKNSARARFSRLRKVSTRSGRCGAIC